MKSIQTGNLLIELLDHKDVVRGISFAQDGSLLMASAARDGTVKLWDLKDDGNMYCTLRTGAKWNNSCKWSHNCKYLAAVGSNKMVGNSCSLQTLRVFLKVVKL